MGRRWIAWLAGMLLALTTVGFVQITYAPSAAACSCAEQDLDELMDGADLIAEIRVLTAGTVAGERSLGEYTVATVREWKGGRQSVNTLRTYHEIPACGLGKLRVEEEFRVWGYSDGDGGYSTTWCSLPRESPAEVDAALEARFGAPWEPDEVASAPADPLSGPGALVLIGASLLGVPGIVALLVVEVAR